MDAVSGVISEVKVSDEGFKAEITKVLDEFELALVGGGIGDVILG